MADYQEKNILKSILRKKFTYNSVKKIIGLGRVYNFLLSKVITKYCLFARADVEINLNSICLTKLAQMSNKDGIFKALDLITLFIIKIIFLKNNRLSVKNINNSNVAYFLFNAKK